MLHLVELGQALRGARQPAVAGHIRDPLAVDEDLPAVLQPFEKLFAGPYGHCRSLLSAEPHPNPPPQAGEGVRRAPTSPSPRLRGEGRVGAMRRAGGWRMRD